MSIESERANRPETLPFPKPGEEVVISGIAGRFPDSDNLTHFQENLFNKVDLVSDDDRRWKSDHPDIPQRTGKLNNLEKFDAQFFGINSNQAHTMESQARMLLEHAYEAVIDAGIHPGELRGTNTGVFIGTCQAESEKYFLYDVNQVDGVAVTGCSRAMYANRISRWFGITGPSYTVDTACSSSLFALDHAFRAIRNGDCDAAFVGGSNLCLHPKVSLQFYRLGVLSSDGRCKSFDADGSGYCRSETVAMIYLQKSKNAKRIYAQVVHTKTNCDGFKEQGITFPSSEMQGALLEKFYEECKVPPSSLAFVEAHGTGTKVGDPVEINTLEKVFCNGRTTPLLIGSIKSNLGHSEAASGICSIAKVVVAMESGFIPPNLYFNRPREGLTALEDGRIQVVTELTPWEGGYVGVNSFGFGGANAHVLLKSNPKEKIRNGLPNDDLPRLVVVSGRTKNAVTTLLDYLESRPVDVEYISLLQNIHAKEIPGHIFRGFTILPAIGLPEKIVRDVQYCSDRKRPVWFVFSGTGSRWTGMGANLLKIPVFSKSMQKCDDALKPYGVNIFDILTKNDTKMVDDILNSFLGTAAVQIGLVDVLSSMEIVPDHIIGHSVGEITCAYADGCLTLEQTILAAYFHGLTLAESSAISGSVVTVSLGYEELKAMCPSEIAIACHDGPRSSTITGPADVMNEFVSKLQARDILIEDKQSNNIAYHSSYIAAGGPQLLIHLQKVIPVPQPRGKKWLSTSVPREKWETSLASSCSPEYYVNNLLSPVLFDEICSLIPNNAITIDVASCGVMQTILQDSLNENVDNITLTKRGSEDDVKDLLEAVGNLFEVGLYPKLAGLYPDVQYPVSRGTPMISPLLRWKHSDDWFVVDFKKESTIDSGERVITVNLEHESFAYMAGHVVDGRNLFPATSYLLLVWQTLGMIKAEIFRTISVVFEDIEFRRATQIPKEGSIQLTIMIQKGTGRFEIFEGGAAVVTGAIRAVSNPSKERVSTEMFIDDKDELELTPKDIYKEFRLRGYQYSGLFRGLKKVSLNGTEGKIAWGSNWAVFMDNMLQMKLIGSDTRGLFVPTGIRKLVIDPKLHSDQLRGMQTADREFTVHVDNDLDIIVSGGVEIRGLKVSAIGRKKPSGDPVVENFKYVAHRDGAETGLKIATRIATQIAIENHFGAKIKSIELIGETDDISPDNLMSLLIQKYLSELPLLQADVNIIAPAKRFADDALPSTINILEPEKLATESEALLVVSHGLLTSKNSEMLDQVKEAIKDEGFLLAREPLSAEFDILSTLKSEDLHVVMEKRSDKELLILLRKKGSQPQISAVIHVNNVEFSWVPELQAALKVECGKKKCSDDQILIVSEGNFESGLLGLVNCLRQEPGGQAIRGLLIQDLNAPKFSLENSLYSEQLKLGLALNVLRPGKSWGSYRFFPMDPLTLQPVYHARLNQFTRGDLSSIKWIEGMIQPSQQKRDVIRVHYSSLNFRDVMLSTGKLAPEIIGKTRLVQECVIGFEFSGRDVNGRAVMGMVASGALSNLCLSDREFLWAVPDDWTLEDAATVPVVYGTAYYALKLSGKMKRGDKVLIHAGTGGVGQAAITLALHEGCEVFTTVGTPEKREFIKNQFPQIDDDHIGNSRDTSFEQLIRRQTQGRGVDIVLNSLAEEKLLASVRCLAQGGRFLEIGKFDLAANNKLGLEEFLKGISFYGIFLDNILSASDEHKRKLALMMTDGMQNGAIKPLVRTVFPMDQTEAAFRYMAAGKHIGKVVVKIRDEDEVSESPLPLALPRYYCSEDGCYLILGGLGGFGLELADWLVLRGARKLVLTSRKGISSGYQSMRVNLWKSYGVKVVVVVGKDASTHDGCEAILKEAIALGPVEAIFNLAVVLKDALYENQTIDSFEESFRVKAWATKQLDRFSRTMCPHLEQFVVFSSVSCGRGNPGQTNYGMANSVMERICERRVEENLPGLAVQWGAVGDVGLVAEMLEDDKEVVIGGTLQQKISSCLQELDGFLKQNSPVVSSMVVAEKTAGRSGFTTIVEAVVDIMELKDLKGVSLHTPLSELGMDSMMAVEIKQTLERDFEIFLTAQEIRTLNFIKLQELSAKKSDEDSNRGPEVAIESENLGGMKMLIQTLGSSERRNDVCVPLETGAVDGRGEVFILPGLEGSYTVFQSLAGKLKSPTTCLQLGSTFVNSTPIDDMADYLMPHIKARCQKRRDFSIVGYSWGSLLAIEIVRRLESEGFSCRLVLIDGSPDFLKALIRPLHISGSEDELDTNFILMMMDVVEPSACATLAVNLKNCSTWEEKLSTFAKNVPDDKRLGYSVDDVTAICLAIYYRIKAALSYNPSALTPLRTPITLIRSEIQSVRAISEDYGLRLLTTKKVEIRYAKGNHLTMLDDDICAAAIDGELIEDIAKSDDEVV